jgi:hypothetical protein
LNDDVLTSLQHFRNELRPARRAGTAALIATVMSRSAAGTAFETRPAGASAAIRAATTTVGTSTSAVWAPTASAVSVASAAPEWPLEARARVTADARGIARELFAGSAGGAAARGTSFAGEQNDVVFDDGRSGNGFAGGGGNHFLFDVFDFDVLVFGMIALVVFVLAVFGLGVFRVMEFMLGVLMLDVHGVAQGCGVLGAFLRDVRGELCAVGGSACFDFFGFFRRELRDLRDFDGRCFFRFVRLFCVFILFELGAADDGIGFRFFLGLFVFCFDDTGSKRGDLVVI